MNRERWKDIPGYEGYYQISNLGRVRSKNRIIKIKDCIGKKYSINRKSVNRKIRTQKNGYCYIGLSIKDKEKVFLIHRLVAISFIPNIHNKPQVNHKDGNKLNNYVKNLEWCTELENKQHAKINGLNYKHKHKAMFKKGHIPWNKKLKN